MADVVKEFVNVLGIEVDQKSADKAEAAMRGWKAAADEVGASLADVGGKVAGFLNALSGFSEAVKLAADTQALAKPLRTWEKSALSLGQTLVEISPWVEAFGAILRQYSARAWAANQATEDIRLTLEELRSEVKKASGGLEGVEKKLKDVKAVAPVVSVANQQLAASTKESAAAHEGAVSKVTRYGDALRAGREIINTLGEAYHFLLGGLLETSRLTTVASRASGVSTKFYQEQAYAISTLGLEADELRDIFLDLSDKAYDADNGGKEQAELFAAIGVKVRGANGELKPMEQLFMDIADGLKGVTNETKRTGIASQLLGEQGARILPIFAKGSEGLREYAREAHDVGAVLSEDALKSSEEFQRGVGRLTAMLTGLRNTVGVALLPVLEKLVKRASDWLMANREVLKLKLKQWVDALSKALDVLLFVFNHWKLALLATAAVLAGPYLAALTTVTTAQVALGIQATIAGAKAAAAALASLGPYALLAAAILLVTEDLYGFETGQDSAFGALYDWVHSFDPEDNPLVMFLKETLKGLTDLVKAGADVLFDITNTEKWGAYLKALINYLIPFSDKIFALFNPFSDVSQKPASPTQYVDDAAYRESLGRERARGAERGALGGFFAPSAAQSDQMAADLARARGQAPAWANGYGLTPSMLTSVTATPTDYFGRGGTTETALQSSQSLQSVAGGTFAPVSTNNITIVAQPGQSATEVGRAAGAAIADRSKADLRAAMVNFKKKGG